MNKVKLGTVLKEEKVKIGKPDGAGLDLIGVSNELGLQVSRAQRITDLSRYKIIRIGWFAYNPMRVNVGSIGIAQGPHHEGIVSPDYVVFSCSEKILPDYLLFFLKSDIGLEAINKNASGAVRKRLYFSDLARIELHVPSIEKQIEILDSVKKIESMVTQLKDPERKGKVSQLKQSILQEAIQGKLTAKWRAKRQADGIEIESAGELLKRIQAEKARLINPSTPLRAGEKKIKKDPSTSLRAGKPLPPITEGEKPFELSEGWEWCRLGELGDTQTGTTPPKTDASNYDSLIPFIQPGNISSDGVTLNCEFLSEKGLKIGRLIQAKSNLMVCIGGSAGKTCFNEIPVSCNQQINTITGYTGVDFRYLDICLKSPHFQNSVWSKIKQGSTPILNKGRWSEIPVPLCSEFEQKAIVDKVESLMEKCRILEEEISQSEQHAQMLMQAVLKEAFKGLIENIKL